MSLRRSLRTAARRVAAHPFTVILPLVVLLVIGWRSYTAAGTQGLDAAAGNILPGSTFTQFDADGVPLGWQVDNHLRGSVATRRVTGQGDDPAWSVGVSKYTSGDLTAVSPKAAVTSGTTYQYKSFYRSTASFTLLVRSYYDDGHTTLATFNSYEAVNDMWTTVNATLTVPSRVRAMQFVYRLSANGELKIDTPSLRARDPHTLYVPQGRPVGRQLVPNADLSSHATDPLLPDDWVHFQTGDNQADFSYLETDNRPCVRTVISHYKTGEAKWQYQPQPVSGGQYYEVGLDYASTMPTVLTAEFELADGHRQFVELVTLPPAAELTHYVTDVEVPRDAHSLFVTPVAHADGRLDVAGATLTDQTKSGPRQFKRPLISITFDDGWESDYLNASRQLDLYGYKGTFYINPSVIGDKNFMSSHDLDDLHRRGHEIGSHAYTHLDDTTLAARPLDYQLRAAHDAIGQHFQIDRPDFAPPYGRGNPEVQAVARKYYASYRTTDDGINTRQNFDAYALKVLYIGDDTPLSRVQRAIADAKDTDGWLILVYHRVEATGQASTVTPAMFDTELQAVHDSAVTVKTVSDALVEAKSQL